MRKNKKTPSKAQKLSDAEAEQTIIDIGSTIKQLMSNTTMDRFSIEVGISKPQLWQYRKGHNMKISTLLTIVYGLGVTPEQFFKKVTESKKGK